MPRTATSLMTDAIATLDLIVRAPLLPGSVVNQRGDLKKADEQKQTLDVYGGANMGVMMGGFGFASICEG